MSIDREPASESPDYELEDVRVVSSTAELRGVFHPLRSTLLELVLERAATVAELAEAVSRPKSTVAYHVNVLVAAGLLRVVRTRRVRAIDERFYGKTARIFYVGAITPEQQSLVTNYLEVAAAESGPAHRDDQLRCVMRYVAISEDHARVFWRKVFELVNDFAQLPRDGERTFAFVAGLYPTEHPTLPDATPATPRA